MQDTPSWLTWQHACTAVCSPSCFSPVVSPISPTVVHPQRCSSSHVQAQDTKFCQEKTSCAAAAKVAQRDHIPARVSWIRSGKGWYAFSFNSCGFVSLNKRSFCIHHFFLFFTFFFRKIIVTSLYPPRECLLLVARVGVVCSQHPLDFQLPFSPIFKPSGSQ